MAQGWGGEGTVQDLHIHYSYSDGYLHANDPYAPGEIFRNDIKRTDEQLVCGWEINI